MVFSVSHALHLACCGVGRGVHKAVVAVAHSVLVVIYHMLRDQRPYSDLGADYVKRLDAARLERYHVRRLSSWATPSR